MTKIIKRCTIFLTALFIFFALCGCATLEVNLKRDGSGSATLTVSREALSERGIETEEQLEAAVEESLKDYNTDWTIVQVKLKDISRTDEAFILDFKLARIQNLHNVGRYELETGSDFLADSNTRNLLKKWSRGQFENLEYSNGKLVSSLAEDIKIYPVKYGSGEVIDAGRVYGKLSAGR